ncbi:MAG: 5-(carboxyamino)imidazole ribonucleotide synthase [Nitrosomonadales bacterium]|nr:MAG: 5-(carboxyamino)imidazole ribonucleotide synthase [Nitrosomonadales bacterium]
MILPPSTLGILGGGQLGRMFAVAARTMGYRVMVLDPGPDSPAGALADIHLCADYHDRAALERMGRACAAVTTEFENVPAESLEFLTQFCPVRPGAAAVAIAQDRRREKAFLQSKGFATAPFIAVEKHADLAVAFQCVGAPALLKTARMGYDGKGQAKVNSLAGLEAAFEQLGAATCILEAWLPLQTEISVVVARGVDGQTAAFPAVENRHANGILDISIAPAQVAEELAGKALETAVAIAAALDYCGVLAVEFFVLDDGRLLVNEIAPRPHNSGHYTLNACLTSQFEQQVRALAGLPLGAPDLLRPAAMVNLLGELWREGQEPPWGAVLSQPRAKLHLYGKGEARPGRKMGHFNVLADSADAALKAALDLRGALTA